MSPFRTALCAVTVAFLAAGSLTGQGLTGQISGTVNDSSGSAVIAEVVLLNQGSGQTRRVDVEAMYNVERCRPRYDGRMGLPMLLVGLGTPVAAL